MTLIAHIAIASVLVSLPLAFAYGAVLSILQTLNVRRRDEESAAWARRRAARWND